MLEQTACATAPARRSASCRAATSSASTSPSACSPNRRSSCSTSPPPRWIRASARCCGSSSAAWRSAAPRSSTPRTTSARPSTTPTASSCSPTASCSSPAPPAELPAAIAARLRVRLRRLPPRARPLTCAGCSSRTCRSCAAPRCWSGRLVLYPVRARVARRHRVQRRPEQAEGRLRQPGARGEERGLHRRRAHRRAASTRRRSSSRSTPCGSRRARRRGRASSPAGRSAALILPKDVTERLQAAAGLGGGGAPRGRGPLQRRQPAQGPVRQVDHQRRARPGQHRALAKADRDRRQLHRSDRDRRQALAARPGDQHPRAAQRPGDHRGDADRARRRTIRCGPRSRGRALRPAGVGQPRRLQADPGVHRAADPGQADGRQGQVLVPGLVRRAAHGHRRADLRDAAAGGGHARARARGERLRPAGARAWSPASAWWWRRSGWRRCARSPSAC